MAGRIVIVLSVVIAASAIANIFLYEKWTALQGELSQLRLSNEELTNKIEKNNQSSTISNTSPTAPMLTGIMPPLPQSGAGQSIGNDNNSRLNSARQSITAAAAHAVPVTDGFFESVRYQGTVMAISVEIRNRGTSLVLVNTDIPIGVDFQTSAKTAVRVAQSMTGTDMNDKDVIFSISAAGNSTTSDLQAVDGPSAGAAMTVLLAAELGGQTLGRSTELEQSVVITGTVNSDGTIGPVGGVPEKAMAAGQYGAKILLVPLGQNVYTDQCCQKKQEGPIFYQSCQSQQKLLSDYMEKKYDMKVIEVKDVKEALAYFLSE